MNTKYEEEIKALKKSLLSSNSKLFKSDEVNKRTKHLEHTLMNQEKHHKVIV